MSTTTTTAATITIASSPTPKSVLIISLSKHLTGHPIATVIDKDWSSKATPAQRAAFDNHGFDLDPTAPWETGLAAIKKNLADTEWDGVLVGWCLRGSSKEWTVLFERVVECVVGDVVRRVKEGKGEGPKLMFCEGPEDLWRTTMRGLGEGSDS